MIVFGSPSRYYQGPGCLSQLGPIVSGFATRAIVVCDGPVLYMLDTDLRSTLDGAGLSFQILAFTGDVTPAAIAALEAEVARGPLAGGVEAVIAVGGGKTIDVGKALCHRLGCAVVTVPTAAANDAPTSKNYVIYDERHALLEVAHLPESPRAVVADTAIIAGAPRALLVAGIGDAITKAFEAAQCHAAGGRNMFGADSSLAALALAEAGYRTVRENATEGLALAGTGQSAPTFERLIEALFLMGGLGFESGGLSIAHAMTRGLSRVEGAASAMHGQQVAYGLLVQIVLEGRPRDFLADMRGFYAEVGLAATLRALGVAEPSDAVYAAIAGATLAAPHARNFTHTLSERDLVEAMRTLEGAGAGQSTYRGDKQ